MLAAIEEHQPRRLFVDALSDLFRLFPAPERRTHFVQALANRLRDRGVTTLFVLEIDAVTGPVLTMPVPNLSAAMDASILLRSVEIRSSLHRMVSVIKQRESAIDRTMRELMIGPEGMSVGAPFSASNLLTGTAAPLDEES